VADHELRGLSKLKTPTRAVLASDYRYPGAAGDNYCSKDSRAKPAERCNAAFVPNIEEAKLNVFSRYSRTVSDAVWGWDTGVS
jgi:hypothetical protein